MRSDNDIRWLIVCPLPKILNGTLSDAYSNAYLHILSKVLIFFKPAFLTLRDEMKQKY